MEIEVRHKLFWPNLTQPFQLRSYATQQERAGFSTYVLDDFGGSAEAIKREGGNSPRSILQECCGAH